MLIISNAQRLYLRLETGLYQTPVTLRHVKRVKAQRLRTQGLLKLLRRLIIKYISQTLRTIKTLRTSIYSSTYSFFIYKICNRFLVNNRSLKGLLMLIKTALQYIILLIYLTIKLIIMLRTLLLVRKVLFYTQ